jgi:hypothetical protein
MTTTLEVIQIATGSIDYCIEIRVRLLQAWQKKSFCCILPLTGGSNPAISFVVMPNQAHPSKCVLSMRVERTLKRRLLKAAKEAKMRLAEFCTYTLLKAVANTSLSTNELQQILKETRDAERNQGPDQRAAGTRSANYPGKAGKA